MCNLCANNLFHLQIVFSALLLEGSFLSIEEKRRAAAMVHEENSKNALIAELKQAVTEKDRFLASVSHELRTPLNGIIGLSDTVLQVS
jgi:signal transduction histidine kinase